MIEPRHDNRMQGPVLLPKDTSAFEHVRDAYPMPSVALGRPPVSDELYCGYQRVDQMPAELYSR